MLSLPVNYGINIRWFFITSLSILLVIINQVKNILDFWILIPIIAGVFLYNFLLSRFAKRKKNLRYAVYFELILDTILISSLIHFSGGITTSPYFFLFPLILLIQIFNKKIFEIIISGSGIIISMSILYYWEQGSWLGFFFLFDRGLIILGVATITGILIKNLNHEKLKYKLELKRKDEKIKKLIDINGDLQTANNFSVQKLEETNMRLVKKNLAMLALHDINVAMGSGFDANKMLKLVLNTSMSLLKADAACLMLLDENAGKLKVKVSRGIDAKRFRVFQSMANQGVENIVLKTGKEKLLVDLSEWSRKYLMQVKSQSKLCIPLKIKGEVVGVISLENSKNNAFTKSDLDIFSMLGSQAAEVLQSIELYGEMKNKAERLTLLFEIEKHIGNIFNLKKLFFTILEKAMQVMKANKGSLMIYDNEKKKLIIRAWHGLQLPEEQVEININEGIAGWVFRSTRAVRIPLVNKSQLFKPENDHWYAGKNLIACPLNVRKKVFGIICLNDRAGNKKFTEEDLQLLNALASQAAIAIENVELYASIRRDYLNAIKALAAAVDAKDHYTHGHSHKVMAYATMIAKELKLNDKEVEKIKYSALLHDIGKIGIAESVLNKPSQLTPEEFKTIAMHPFLGASIVRNIESLKDLIPIILCHHERYDGQGYPEGIIGNNIPLGARIVSVADAWDVMTSDRAYRKALPKEMVIKEFKKCAGEQFDPQIVKAFLNTLDKGYKIEPFKIEEEISDSIWAEAEISNIVEMGEVLD